MRVNMYGLMPDTIHVQINYIKGTIIITYTNLNATIF